MHHVRRTLYRSLTAGGLAFLAYTFVGIVFALRYFLLSVANPSITFSIDLALWYVIGWWVWVLLTPVVLYLARRFPLEKGSLPRRLGVHLIGWMGLSVVDVVLFHALRLGFSDLGSMPSAQVWEEFRLSLIGTAALDLLVYAAIVAISHAYISRQALREQEIRTTHLQAQLARARLQALEMQLHPHFLFNTLNAISALMDEDVGSSRKMITLLSELLRLTLDTLDEQEVTVRKETAFIERYLEIQQIRFRGRLEAEIEVDAPAWDALVPTLIIQPLVENAVKHGAPKNGKTARIRIEIRRRGGSLVIRVADNGPGLPECGEAGLKPGIGLRNTRERLGQLYGAGDHLVLTRSEEGGLAAVVTVPFYREADKLEVIEAD